MLQASLRIFKFSNFLFARELCCFCFPILTQDTATLTDLVGSTKIRDAFFKSNTINCFDTASSSGASFFAWFRIEASAKRESLVKKCKFSSRERRLGTRQVLIVYSALRLQFYNRNHPFKPIQTGLFWAETGGGEVTL